MRVHTLCILWLHWTEYAGIIRLVPHLMDLGEKICLSNGGLAWWSGERHMKQVVVLCGFMGCGKTTVGRELSRLTGFAYRDLDEWIEMRAGKTVADIFEQDGEAHFRALEREAVRACAEEPALITAAGGGALTFDENVKALQKAGCRIILLDVPVEEIARRLQGDKTRPLLNRPDKEAAMRKLYEARLPLYRKAADLAVDANQPPEQVAREIVMKLGLPFAPKE